MRVGAPRPAPGADGWGLLGGVGLLRSGGGHYAAAQRDQTLAIAQEQAEGFIEGSSLTVLNRNYYFNRDYRKGQSAPSGNGYSEAWAHGIISRFESGFTQGTVGVGVDAFAMLGLKLDTGDGRNGGRSSFDVLPVNTMGAPNAPSMVPTPNPL